MAKTIMAVLTNPVSESREEEFNDWYTRTHLKDVVAVPGYVAASRFRLVDKEILEGSAQPQHRYLAIYEIESDDLEKSAHALRAALQDGMFISDSLEISSAMANFYQAVGDRVEAQ